MCEICGEILTSDEEPKDIYRNCQSSFLADDDIDLEFEMLRVFGYI